jgi:adenosylcobinamide kinase / adenosylcobinamide-phosphate guanylyltransferase
MRELIIGGQKSGKSRAAEHRAERWLQTDGHEAALLATALPGDAEMAERIARHQADRRERTPRLLTIEVGRCLPQAISTWSGPSRLIVVDCLTLWLTQLMLPVEGPLHPSSQVAAELDALLAAATRAPGPLIFVSNEIGLGVAPMSVEARRFVDALGLLHQRMGAICEMVTLMVAGIECPIRRSGV